MSERIHTSEVLVVGAGPAGMAAACCAAEDGRKVTLIDDNPEPGGQIWRSSHSSTRSTEAQHWLDRIRTSNVEVIRGARVFAQHAENALLAETLDGVIDLRFSKLILASGGRELLLPFPGWTLPNVTGAGGLQALVKSGLPIKDKIVIVAGSGPLLVAVAAYLATAGADVRLIAEQAHWSKLLSFGLKLLSQGKKASQALTLSTKLKGTRYLTGCWPIAAHGDRQLESVTLRRGSRLWKIECDYLACGFHLVPNVELALLLGCALLDGCVDVNKYQETSVSGVYCAGESTGIGGLELSLAEGRIAGYAATGRLEKAESVFDERARHGRFAGRLNAAFALRPELKSLAADETFVCRCEDVTFGRMRVCASWREAKLQTRSGMGPCQGRICGAAAEFLFGWGVDSVRPPVFPATLEALATTGMRQES